MCELGMGVRVPSKSLRDEIRRLWAMVAERDAIIEDQKRRITNLEQQVLQFASQLESLLGGKKRTPELPPGPGLFPDLVAEVGDGDDESDGDHESDDEDDKPKPGAGRDKDRNRKRGVDTTGLAQRDVIHELPEAERQASRRSIGASLGCVLYQVMTTRPSPPSPPSL